MSLNPSSNTVVARLEQALATNELPFSAQKVGFRLLNRLNSPVRVAVMGVDKRNSVMLINALSGLNLLPETGVLPSVEVAFGPKEKTSFLVDEEVISTVDGIAQNQPVPNEVNLLRLETPRFGFENISLLYTALSGSNQSQTEIMAWAAARTDIALWLTDDFAPLEQDLWAHADDTLRHNSFLVLAHADAHIKQGTLEPRIAALRPVADTQFSSLFAISARMAAASLIPNQPVDPKRWAASGAEVLRATIAKRVRSGLEADTDGALLFLSKYGITATTDDTQLGNVPATPPAPPPMPIPKPPAGDPHQPPAGAVGAALHILQTGAEALDTSLSYIGTDAASDILDHCLAVSNSAIDMFADMPDDNPQQADLQQDFLEVSDMLMLMQQEKDADAAADAVSLLLQLKRDLELQTAA